MIKVWTEIEQLPPPVIEGDRCKFLATVVAVRADANSALAAVFGVACVRPKDLLAVLGDAEKEDFATLTTPALIAVLDAVTRSTGAVWVFRERRCGAF